MRIFLILLVLSLVLFAYPVWRLGDWLNLSITTKLIVTTPLFLSQFIARWGLRPEALNPVYVIAATKPNA